MLIVVHYAAKVQHSAQYSSAYTKFSKAHNSKKNQHKKSSKSYIIHNILNIHHSTHHSEAVVPRHYALKVV